ncbi:DNA damage-binding protein 1a [Orobanche minor]
MVLEPMLDVNINGDIVLLELICPNESDAETRDFLVMATRNFCGFFEWNHVESNLLTRSFMRIPEPDRGYYYYPTKLA